MRAACVSRLAKHPQSFVAGEVAVPVVDRCEVVELGHHDADAGTAIVPPAASSAPKDSSRNLLLYKPVSASCVEAFAQHRLQVEDLACGQGARGDVHHQAHQEGVPDVDRAQVALDLDDVAVLAQPVEGEDETVDLTVHARVDLSGDQRAITLDGELDRSEVTDLHRVVAEDLVNLALV